MTTACRANEYAHGARPSHSTATVDLGSIQAAQGSTQADLESVLGQASECAILGCLGMPGKEGGGAVQDLGVLLGVHNVGVVQGDLLRSTEVLLNTAEPQLSAVSLPSALLSFPAACACAQQDAGSMHMPLLHIIFSKFSIPSH